MQSEVVGRVPSHTRSELIQRAVVDSYAHNSRLYRYFEESASLEEIVRFLQWDAVQPPFNRFLRLWIDKVPEYLRDPLSDHIAEEEVGGHSALFQAMMANLTHVVNPTVEVDDAVLNALNYTFSPECAAEQDHAFFAGAFFATEVMSQKRCQQLWNGLTRHGLHSDGNPADGPAPSEPSYLEVHALADGDHGAVVLELFVHRILEREPHLSASIWDGLQDRLSRSARYLRWYEKRYL